LRNGPDRICIEPDRDRRVGELDRRRVAQVAPEDDLLPLAFDRVQRVPRRVAVGMRPAAWSPPA
jgi:hypothetical protein